MLQHWVLPVTFPRTAVEEVEPRFGMTAKKSPIAKHTEDVLLHPPSDPTYYVLCRPVPDARGAFHLERTNCEVGNMFAEYLELEYVVPYADLARLDTINTEMVAWIQQFIDE